MQVQSFDSISAAREAVMDFRADHLADLPEDKRDQFKTLMASPSPVDQIVKLGEFLWANRANVHNRAKALAGGLISFATTNAWHGLLDDGRGDKIVQALRRDLGETAPTGVTWPAEADDPEGKPEFAEPTPPAVPGS